MTAEDLVELFVVVKDRMLGDHRLDQSMMMMNEKMVSVMHYACLDCGRRRILMWGPKECGRRWIF